MKKVTIIAGALALTAGSLFSSFTQAAETAICYNCPPEWADWGTQLNAIAKDTGIQVPQDNKNSGQALAQMVAEKGNPVADVVYYGVSFGIQADSAGVISSYKPAHWDEIPAGMKDPDGKWVALHSGTMGFMVNVDALGGAPVPQSWDDLLKPEYKGMIGYLDPASAFVGYVAAVAVNQAKGGNMNDFTPALTWFKKLQANQPIVPKQTAYARLISGEIPILLDYDFNAYRAKYKDHANVAFVIPKEGTVTVPYVISLVKNAPHADNGKKVIDYVLSDKGQAIWANAFLRPVRTSAMSAEAKKFFLSDSDYARAQTVNYQQMADAQKAFSAKYLSEIR
ncbi:putative spermidine/putrescine transport system substrate-binding protein [Candidatus Pantoea symbiotica]|jgi:putative spermidine/putrescine transport system substrate-binding protein|uniref:Spermidine/putrescine transport system substrate-binding protein n=1 Tax=Candidatus Pantoea symbiotica TaxID=1884370 RepID=A0A1I3WEI0_9GAMM|nr:MULTISPECIES: ABC transporter substrate-binding protein [Pantoea]KAJ9432238.1 ABC transporter substrate-binding protein [Pantoea sp. YR343]SFK04836.1 putative spermidine/putrescine transport system substrate-binding protein [Pantoea symbiotica]SFU71481.1 putative spermidine/putrescine transport system substrate-binding protein [Pantoea sp. YR525]